MASITKQQNGKYRALIRRKGYRTVSRTFTRKKDATAWARRIEGDRELLLAEGSIGRTMTLADLIDEYAPQWKDRDRTTLSRLAWWKTEYGHMAIGDINLTAIKAGLRKLRTTWDGNKPGVGRSASTVNRYRHALSGVLSYAVDNELLAYNPVKSYKPSEDDKEPRGRVRYLSDQERKALLKACKASKWDGLHLIVLLAITTGARRAELTGLRWRDVDLKDKIASLEKTKNGEPRELPLTDQVVAELKAYKEKAVQDGEVTDLTRYRDIEGKHIFASRQKPDRPFVFEKYWRKALADAEIENFKFHDLRHTCASYLAKSGASIIEIANVLGHKQVTVTKRYAHLDTDDKADLVNRVLGDLDG